MTWTSVLFLLNALTSTAAPVSDLSITPINHVIHERRNVETGDWTRLNRLPGHKLLPMRIGMTQQNLHLGSDLLAEISHPDSSRFGQHLSSEEIVDLFAPAQDTVSAVVSWLEENAIEEARTVLSGNKGWIAFDATVDEAERLLRTEYYQFEHTESGHRSFACDFYHVPEHIQGQIGRAHV